MKKADMRPVADSEHETVTINGVEVREDGEWRFIDLARFSMWTAFSGYGPTDGPKDYAINEDGIVCHIPSERFFAPSVRNKRFIYIHKERFLTAWLLAMAFSIPRPCRVAYAAYIDETKPAHVSNVVWLRGRRNKEETAV
jgi:hypothetical protein